MLKGLGRSPFAPRTPQALGADADGGRSTAASHTPRPRLGRR